MRFLIVRLGAIGDIVHALPALAVLRRSMPQAHISWVVEKGASAKLLKGNPCLDDLVELDLRGWRKRLFQTETIKEITSSIKGLRKNNYDISLDFQGLLKSAMVPWFARVPRRIGFDNAGLREPAASWLLTEQVKVDDKNHVIEKNLQLIEHLDIQTSGKYEFPILLEKDDLYFAERQMEQHNGAYAILNPGGGWPTKLWSAQGFAEIAGRLWEHYGIHSIVTFGPGEENLAREVVEKSRHGAATMLASSLKEFFALAGDAKLFLGGDTGPMHLAAAAGTPIVSIFGPTSSRRNGPFAPDDIVVERIDLDCRIDCHRRKCSHTSCMSIPFDSVWLGVTRRLDSKSTTGDEGESKNRLHSLVYD